MKHRLGLFLTKKNMNPSSTRRLTPVEMSQRATILACPLVRSDVQLSSSEIEKGDQTGGTVRVHVSFSFKNKILQTYHF